MLPAPPPLHLPSLTLTRPVAVPAQPSCTQAVTPYSRDPCRSRPMRTWPQPVLATSPGRPTADHQRRPIRQPDTLASVTSPRRPRPPPCRRSAPPRPSRPTRPDGWSGRWPWRRSRRRYRPGNSSNRRRSSSWSRPESGGRWLSMLPRVTSTRPPQQLPRRQVSG